MAGAYCKFCGHRCFVYRVIPGGPDEGWAGHMATCPAGKAFDRKATGGYDADNAINPAEPDPEPHYYPCPSCGGNGCRSCAGSGELLDRGGAA